MSGSWSKWGWGLIVLAASTGAAWEIFADRAEDPAENPQKPSVAVETLLPADTVLYVRHDGTKQHAAAWEHTAAHEALSAARTDELLEKLVTFLKQQAPGTFDSRVEGLARHLSAYGGSLAISIPKGLPLPRATLVLHHAAKHVDLLSEGVPLLAENGIKTETKDIEGREVHLAHLSKTPAMDLAWWAEGGHLVIAVGVDPVEHVLAIANGKNANITRHRLWAKEAADKNRTISSTAWVDAKSLREKVKSFPIPIPEGRPLFIGDALELLGLHNLDDVVFKGGYEGKALWSETDLHITGKRTGLLSLLDGKEISFEDLPPLPLHVNSFFAASMNPAAAYETVRRTIREAAAYGPKEAALQVDRVIDTLPNFLGFDPKTDILDALGSLVVVCDDPDQGFLGTGGTLIVQVKDAKKLRQTFENIINKLNSLSPNEEIAKIHKATKQGREIWNVELGQTVQGLGIGITDDWMVIALVPQPVEAFYLRVDGKLPKWSKSQLKEEGAPILPEKFTTLAVSNPRMIYHSLLKLAPLGMATLVASLKGEGTLPRKANLPWLLSDLPPAELVVGPLFPNVRSMSLTEEGVRWTSYASLPSLPVLGGPGGGNGALAASVVTALLLPAIQQSRVAAKRSQSKNNLKQLGLAMHNYHDTYKSFPAGTLPNEKLKPDERLSFLGRVVAVRRASRALYKKIDKEAGWQEKDIRPIMETRVPVFINPGVNPDAEKMTAKADSKEKKKPKDNYAPTHYVGLAGVGKDAPLLPITSNRAGVFGYNRKTRIRDITDGTSNTIMIGEASKDYGEWGAGGTATIRSLTKKPYINGPDGIGGPFPGGCHFLMGDGSVRFVSEKIDPKTLEALTTIRGGEVVGDF